MRDDYRKSKLVGRKQILYEEIESCEGILERIKSNIREYSDLNTFCLQTDMLEGALNIMYRNGAMQQQTEYLQGNLTEENITKLKIRNENCKRKHKIGTRIAHALKQKAAQKSEIREITNSKKILLN